MTSLSSGVRNGVVATRTPFRAARIFDHYIVPTVVGMSFFSLVLVAGAGILPEVALGAAYLTLLTVQLVRLFNTKLKYQLQRLPRKWKVGAIFLFSIAAVLALSEPVHAFLLDRAEAYMVDFITTAAGAAAGGGGAGDVDAVQVENIIALVFGLIRIVFIIYVCAALISVINSARDGQDWQTVARTPAIVIAIVLIVDVLSVIIIPDVAGGGAP